MEVLFLENDDSFSWNVIDLLPFERHTIRVVSGRATHVWQELVPSAPRLVIGPGPLDPNRLPNLQFAVQLAKDHRVPTLGICLGHQAIGLHFGATLNRTEPHHGKVDEVRFQASRFFPMTPDPVAVMRYHSLILDDVRPPLRATAFNGQGLVMAIEHESLPIAGLQFHPDSYATTTGGLMLSRFFSTAS